MICPNCKKQIPDNSDKCPLCNTEIIHKTQVVKEIKTRRWQRWFFYLILIIVFLGMVGVIVKMSDSNSKILVEMAGIKNELKSKTEELESTKTRTAELEGMKTKLESEREELTGNLSSAEEELQRKILEIEEGIDNKIWAEKMLENAISVFKDISLSIGEEISKENLEKIQLAEILLQGDDTDEDGLCDKFEEILGTDINKSDSDDDGYSDRDEIMRGYNPTKEGKLPIDQNFANAQKGKILFVLDNGNRITWFVGSNGKRYLITGEDID